MTQALGAGRRDRADDIARAVVGVSTWMGGIGALAALVARQAAAAADQCTRRSPAPGHPAVKALAPALMIDAWNANMASVLRAALAPA